jgi:anti-sigma factor RsiW
MKERRTMRSRKIAKLISKSLDAELTATERRRLDRALQRDADARRLWHELEMIGDAFEPMQSIEPRPGFAGRTLARLDDIAQGPTWWTALVISLRPVPLTAAAAALVFGVVLAVSMNGHVTASATSAGQTDLLYTEMFDLTPFDGADDLLTPMIDDTEQ